MDDESLNNPTPAAENADSETAEKRAKIQRMLGYFLFCRDLKESGGDMVHSVSAQTWRADGEKRMHWINQAGDLMTELEGCGVSFSARHDTLRKKLKTLATVPAAFAYHED